MHGHSEGQKHSSTVPTMTDEVDSGEKREISSCISETVMSFVAVLAPAPSKSRVMEKVSEQLYSSTDLGLCKGKMVVANLQWKAPIWVTNSCQWSGQVT